MPKRKRKKQAKEDKGNIVYKYNGVYKTKKYFGVYKRGFKKFKAQVLINNKMFYPGTFKTALEAAKAHDHARIQAGHPITKLNFPDQVPKNYKPKKKKNFHPPIRLVTEVCTVPVKSFKHKLESLCIMKEKN